MSDNNRSRFTSRNILEKFLSLRTFCLEQITNLVIQNLNKIKIYLKESMLKHQPLIKEPKSWWQYKPNKKVRINKEDWITSQLLTTGINILQPKINFNIVKLWIYWNSRYHEFGLLILVALGLVLLHRLLMLGRTKQNKIHILIKIHVSI